jgi:hypothetical protein
VLWMSPAPAAPLKNASLCSDWLSLGQIRRSLLARVDIGRPNSQSPVRTGPLWPVQSLAGNGKTLGVLAAWLYHRVERNDDRWPRRRVWVLPMRVLVEQTADEVQRCLARLGLLWQLAEAGVDISATTLVTELAPWSKTSSAARAYKLTE